MQRSASRALYLLTHGHNPILFDRVGRHLGPYIYRIGQIILLLTSSRLRAYDSQVGDPARVVAGAEKTARRLLVVARRESVQPWARGPQVATGMTGRGCSARARPGGSSVSAARTRFPHAVARRRRPPSARRIDGSAAFPSLERRGALRGSPRLAAGVGPRRCRAPDPGPGRGARGAQAALRAPWHADRARPAGGGGRRGGGGLRQPPRAPGPGAVRGGGRPLRRRAGGVPAGGPGAAGRGRRGVGLALPRPARRGRRGVPPARGGAAAGERGGHRGRGRDDPPGRRFGGRRRRAARAPPGRRRGACRRGAGGRPGRHGATGGGLAARPGRDRGAARGQGAAHAGAAQARLAAAGSRGGRRAGRAIAPPAGAGRRDVRRPGRAERARRPRAGGARPAARPRAGAGGHAARPGSGVSP